MDKDIEIKKIVKKRKIQKYFNIDSYTFVISRVISAVDSKKITEIEKLCNNINKIDKIVQL